MAISFSPQAETIRTAQYRLIRHPEKGGEFDYELYDHTGTDGETKNLAEEKPEVVKELSALMDGRKSS